ncbi:MAG: hypothetical protein HYZ15_16225 [Sphingobacteriales bacterium]|nr:hypothetical protein [Sphingobacteriales bacterium]
MRPPPAIILFIFFILMYSESPAQPASPDCRSFRTGNFLFTDSAGIPWELKRTKHRQAERNKSNGTVIKFKINWFNDCEYRLTQTWSNDRVHRKWNREHFSYRIISTTEQSYSCNCLCKNGPVLPGGTVVRAGY